MNGELTIEDAIREIKRIQNTKYLTRDDAVRDIQKLESEAPCAFVIDSTFFKESVDEEGHQYINPRFGYSLYGFSYDLKSKVEVNRERFCDFPPLPDFVHLVCTDTSKTAITEDELDSESLEDFFRKLWEQSDEPVEFNEQMNHFSEEYLDRLQTIPTGKPTN